MADLNNRCDIKAKQQADDGRTNAGRYLSRGDGITGLRYYIKQRKRNHCTGGLLHYTVSVSFRFWTYLLFLPSLFILLAYSMQKSFLISRSRKVSTQLLSLFPLFNFSNTQYSYSPLKPLSCWHLILNTQYSSLILLFFHSVLTVRYSSLNTR